MFKLLTVMETREMSKKKIQVELGKRAKFMEDLGIDHEEACAFISSIMNLGIAAHEKTDEN